MPIVPYLPSAEELGLEAHIAAVSSVTDETLRWILTIFMRGYHISAREAAQKATHAVAGMACLPDDVIPEALQKRISDMAYEVLGDIVEVEAAVASHHGAKPDGTPTRS